MHGWRSPTQNQVLVSAGPSWEITTKQRLERLPEAGDVPARLPDIWIARGSPC
jgi:PIN domain nuclease of toxin-antitoxin system